MSRISLHRGHGLVGCSRQPATVAAATIARLGLWLPDLYIRRGYAIIRDRQDQGYLRIGSLPLGLGVWLPLSVRPCPLGSGVIYQGL
jgi:hypothetical protein